ncbi:MAG: histidine kinase [Saprospiraceae bacterium]|nr:histidine kinase [Candidatus Vicinibacter affinis]
MIQQISEIKQEALNAQMSDHFISNTMSSINRFIEENDKDKASAYLLKFSRLIRKVLENSFKKTVTLKDDLEIMEQYIELEKLRFPVGLLNYNIWIDECIEVEFILVPPMILQVLAENSINHGFSKSKGGMISLKIYERAEILEFIIEDNGIGRMASSANQIYSNRKSFGSGLAEKLLQAFNNTIGQSSLRIVDLHDQNSIACGTRIEYNIPVLYAA